MLKLTRPRRSEVTITDYDFRCPAAWLHAPGFSTEIIQSLFFTMHKYFCSALSVSQEPEGGLAV